MRISVGMDVAKAVHWACAIDEVGRTLLDRAVENTPEGITSFSADLRAHARARCASSAPGSAARWRQIPAGSPPSARCERPRSQFHAVEPAALEAAQELGPEGFGFRGANAKADDLASAIMLLQ